MCKFGKMASGIIIIIIIIIIILSSFLLPLHTHTHTHTHTRTYAHTHARKRVFRLQASATVWGAPGVAWRGVPGSRWRSLCAAVAALACVICSPIRGGLIPPHPRVRPSVRPWSPAADGCSSGSTRSLQGEDERLMTGTKRRGIGSPIRRPNCLATVFQGLSFEIRSLVDGRLPARRNGASAIR